MARPNQGGGYTGRFIQTGETLSAVWDLHPIGGKARSWPIHPGHQDLKIPCLGLAQVLCFKNLKGVLLTHYFIETTAGSVEKN